MTDPTEAIRKALASDHPREEIDLEAIRALLDRLDSAERDAGRYRWLRSDDIEVLPGQREISVVLHRLPFTDEPDVTLIEADLDAAIDAALRAGEQKEPK